MNSHEPNLPSGQKLPAAHLETLLSSATNADEKGAQQFFLKPEFALSLARGLPPVMGQSAGLGSRKITVADLTGCGSGNLLAATKRVLGDTAYCVGAEIDPRFEADGRGSAIRIATADTTLLAPLLDQVHWQAGLMVLNPPFGLNWHVDRLDGVLAESSDYKVADTWKRATRGKDTIDSSLASYLTALHFLEYNGAGMLVTLWSTWESKIASTPAADHVYSTVRIPKGGHLFDPLIGDFDVAAIYFAKDHLIGDPRSIETLPSPSAEAVAQAIADGDPAAGMQGMKPRAEGSLWKDKSVAWLAANREYKELHDDTVTPDWNLTLNQDGTIRCHLTPFQNIGKFLPAAHVEALDDLRGQTPMGLTVQRSTRVALLNAVRSDLWRVDPKLIRAVESAVEEYNSHRAPLYPLPPVQRLGYLDEEDMVQCAKDLGPFKAGDRYYIETDTEKATFHTTIMDREGMPNEVLREGKELVLTVYLDGKRDDETAHKFIIGGKYDYELTDKPENSNQVHTFNQFIDHFIVPDVDDVATMDPEGYQEALAKVDAIGADMAERITEFDFSWFPYQREDLARSALMPGVVFSWEQGLGKSLAAFAWPQVRGAKLTLLVAPGSLHTQLAEEGRSKFGLDVRLLETLDDAMADPDLRRRLLTGKCPEQPIYYLTTYTALGMNGADERAPELRTKKGAEFFYLSDNAQKMRRETAPDLNPFDDKWEGVGETRDYPHGRISCIHRPCMGRVLQTTFDAVVCDEATRIKGDHTYVSTGVRMMDPASRLVLTGTPIKNRLTDLFWLCQWAAGGHDDPTARWPYANTIEAKQSFASEHLVSERNLTKEAEAEHEGKRRTYKKQTNEICGLHRLWKLLAPTVLRRRKAEVGKDLVEKRVIPMRVTMGKQQAELYQDHLSNPPKYTKDGDDMTELAALATQLGYLRQVAICPDSETVNRFTGASGWVPKNAAILELVRERLAEGEQMVIFSPFQDYSTWITNTLKGSGVSTVKLDGSVSPKQRGILAGKFKRKEYAVLVAGLKSMGEGHSFDQCPNLILPSLEWAYDNNAQAIERVHRLTSKQAVRIYTFIAKGTIDERLASLFNEKSDASDLALDGQLFKADTEEVNLFELLQRAMDDFDPDAETTDEQQVFEHWQGSLKDSLAAAHEAWLGKVDRPVDPTPTPTPPSRKPAPVTRLTVENTDEDPGPSTGGITVEDPIDFDESTLVFPTRFGIRPDVAEASPAPVTGDDEGAIPPTEEEAEPANVIPFPGSKPAGEPTPSAADRKQRLFPAWGGGLRKL